MQLVCEGDYCTHGFNVVLRQVIAGNRPLPALVRKLSGKCTDPSQHTPACVEFFHHKCFTIPKEHAVKAAICWCDRAAPDDVHSAIDRFLTEGLQAVAIVSRFPVKFLHPRHVKKLNVLASDGVPCTVLLNMLEILTRESAIISPLKVIHIEDAHAASEMRSYRTWLTTKKCRSQQEWCKTIEACVYKSCHALPKEIVRHILSYIFT